MLDQPVTVMKIPTLATVYLDNEPVGLMGDPRPRVSKIVVAGGKQPGLVQVLRSGSPGDSHGKPVGLEDIIDRTVEPTVPIYLTCVTRLAKPPVATNVATSRAASARAPAPLVAIPLPGPEPRLPNPLPAFVDPDEPQGPDQ